MIYSTDGQKEYHIDLKKGDIGRFVIMPGDPGRCGEIAKRLENPYKVAQKREFCTYNGTLEGELVSVVSTGIGGPSAAIALEECVNAGADTFIRVGTCGAMQENILGGDMIIATGAVRMEGTTREYAPIEYPAIADREIVAALEKAAEKMELTAHVGVVQSKDSFYSQHSPETKPVSAELMAKWEAWKRMGCLASEMEGAALFIVGQYRRVRVGACFLVMANQERAKAGLDNPVVHDTGTAIDLGVEAMRLIIRQNKDNA
ncbi:MAG: uridine phosphorylase [Lachnospiraceae bacterium]|nr:uridine phosphorylase [Lachnospiraceae bacterium]